MALRKSKKLICLKSIHVLLWLAVAQLSPASTVLCPALAQTETNANSPEWPPLTAPDKATLSRAIALAKQEELCTTPIALKVTDASLADIIAQVRIALTALAPIEVRTPDTARFTLDLKDIPVGKVLQAAAGLTGGNLYLFPDRLLIDSGQQLSVEERAEGKEWSKSRLAVGTGWYAAGTAQSMLTRYIALTLEKEKRANPTPDPDGLTTRVNASGEDPLNTLQIPFAQLSPELAQMLRQLIVWRENQARTAKQAVTPLQLSPGSLLSLSFDSLYKRLEIKAEVQPHRSNLYVWEEGLSPAFRQQIKSRQSQPRSKTK